MTVERPGRITVMHTAQAEYLGDGVYADICSVRGLVLTTENGLEAQNIVFLEPDVVASLMRYLSTHKP